MQRWCGGKWELESVVSRPTLLDTDLRENVTVSVTSTRCSSISTINTRRFSKTQTRKCWNTTSIYSDTRWPFRHQWKVLTSVFKVRFYKKKRVNAMYCFRKFIWIEFKDQYIKITPLLHFYEFKEQFQRWNSRTETAAEGEWEWCAACVRANVRECA